MAGSVKAETVERILTNGVRAVAPAGNTSPTDDRRVRETVAGADRAPFGSRSSKPSSGWPGQRDHAAGRGHDLGRKQDIGVRGGGANLTGASDPVPNPHRGGHRDRVVRSARLAVARGGREGRRGAQARRRWRRGRFAPAAAGQIQEGNREGEDSLTHWAARWMGATHTRAGWGEIGSPAERLI